MSVLFLVLTTRDVNPEVFAVGGLDDGLIEVRVGFVVDIKLDSKFISSLSDFVHGLSTTLLVVELDVATFEPVYGVSISLLSKLREQLERLYAKDMPKVRENMLSALYDSAMPEQYVEYIWGQANVKLMPK